MPQGKGKQTPRTTITVYLLSSDVESSAAAISNDNNKIQKVKVTVAGKKRDLFVQPAVVHPSRWVRFFGGDVNPEDHHLMASSPSAVLLIPHKKRLFALTFGHGRHLLRPGSWVERFDRCGKDLKYGHDLGDTAVEICAAFTGKVSKWQEVADAVGHQNAYTIMVGGDLGDSRWDGIAWQCMPLYDLGHHARRWSDEALAIALIADPRIKPCSRKQHDTLVDLCAELCLMFGIDPLGTGGDGVPWLAGHDELPHGSRDPTKRCPGDLLPMDEVRRDVAALTREAALQRMLGRGLFCSP